VSVQSYRGHTTYYFLCVWHLSTLTSAHHQQFHTTTYIFSFAIISSFLLKKKHTGNFAFLFQSVWRNRLLNRIECLCKPMATMLYRKQHAEIGFAGSMTTILTWMTRSVKIGPGRLRTVNYRLFWTRTIPNRKKCLPSNWVFLKQTFSCGYMPWGRFKRSENGCRMNWTIGRWSDAKTHANSACQTKKKVVPASDCDRLWKVESIFRILNARNGLIPPNHQHLPQDQIASDGRRCCAFGEIKRVSSTTSC